MTGRFPFTLPPLPDEPFGLWWHTYAARLAVTTTELTRAAGLPTDRPPERQHARAIAAVTGLSTDQVTATFTTTRACPPACVLRVWTPQPVSRFCPPCLREHAARTPGWSAGWPAAWQLPLTFHCLTHNQPFATCCPACQQPPTSRPPDSPNRAGPSACPACGHNLASTARRRAPVTHARGAAATAQRRITDALHRLRDPHGTPASRQQAQHELTDITLLAAHLTGDRAGRHAGGLPDAAAFTAAVRYLRPPRTAADPLAGLVARCYRRPRIPAVPASWRPASPTLTHRIVHSRQSDLSPLDRLRHATTLPTPTIPDRAAADPAPGRAAQLPDQLWPVWAIRLTDDDAIDGPYFRSAMTAALLLPHSDLPLGRLAALLPHQPVLEAVSHQLRRLATLPNTDAVLRILTELALAIDRHGVPIDYARRRRLAVETTLLDQPTWRALSRGSGLHIGRRRRLDLARCYLYELLTGGSLTTAPPPYQLADATLRTDHIEFAAAMPAPLAAALTAHAEGLLATGGITGEPLTWHPPTTWVTITRWPGADPETTDPAPIHHAVRDRWATTPHNRWAPTHAVAANLGISSQHLREVLRRHPLPATPYRPNRRSLIATPANGGPPHRTEHHPDHPRRVVHLDLDWLREQRTTWGRTLHDVAAEIGVTRATLRNFTAEHHIPPQPRGGSTTRIHTGAAPAHPADLPDLLRAALRGPAARARLERFLLITDQPHPSLTAAAASIGAHQSRLTAQLRRLEHACGGHLLQRRPNPQPLGPPTALGQQLRRQALDHLDRTPP